MYAELNYNIELELTWKHGGSTDGAYEKKLILLLCIFNDVDIRSSHVQKQIPNILRNY